MTPKLPDKELFAGVLFGVLIGAAWAFLLLIAAMLGLGAEHFK
ncbi:hypothetical protein [Serratia bockelmannii]